MTSSKKPLSVIGKTCTIDIVGYSENVPAKVDTGADSSAIWSSNIEIDQEGMLHFTLFDKSSEFYTGERLSRKNYKVAKIRSSSGHTQIRYRTELIIRVGGRRIRALFNLSDRSNNKFPILLGRRTLTGKFIVDVRKGRVNELPRSDSRALNDELQHNPYEFFKKYHKS